MATLPRRGRSLVVGGLILASFSISFLTGCSRQTRYQVLTFFFTGVPPLEGAKKPAGGIPSPGEKAEEAAPTQVAKKPPPLHKHKPFEEGNCSACHDLNKGNVLFNEPDKLCFRCHDDFAKSLPWVHGPVAVGSCTSCHEPHESRNEFLLITASQDICFKCHAQRDILSTAYHSGVRDTGCIDCHDPHGGVNRWLLKSPGEPPKHKALEIGEIKREPEVRFGAAAGYKRS